MGVASQIKEFRNNIAASLWIKPCTEEELIKRDFLLNYSLYGIQRTIMDLERRGAIYYRGDTMFIYKKWAKENLTEYEFDFD